MQIAGLQKTTLVDYPGKVACTVFTPGCNFRCPYCHNPEIIAYLPGMDLMPEEAFYSWLFRKKKWLDGVCITGGEPTIQPDLVEFARKVKSMGFLFKLDTNGTNPRMLKQMLDESLADFVAMDIKAPLEDYPAVTKTKVDLKAIEQSVKMIMERAPDYEFRTTVGPAWYSKGYAKRIGEWLDGAKIYYLQQYVAGKTLDPKLSQVTYSRKDLEELAEILKPHFGKVEIRGI
ncbi:MAG: anaerobic ribonucleoside-triphosphate reductase activating protein [Candidatus Micrarchaeia archaeon]|jgi:pyruvate formate lyase activating enzyme